MSLAAARKSSSWSDRSGAGRWTRRITAPPARFANAPTRRANASDRSTQTLTIAPSATGTHSSAAMSRPQPGMLPVSDSTRIATIGMTSLLAWLNRPFRLRPSTDASVVNDQSRSRRNATASLIGPGIVLPMAAVETYSAVPRRASSPGRNAPTAKPSTTQPEDP